MRARSIGLLTASVAASIFFGSAAQAQTNPFIPQSAASRAEIERIVEQKMKELEARVVESAKTAASNAVPSSGGDAVSGAPGAPVPAGAGVPGAPSAPPVAGPLNPAGPTYPPVGAVPGAAGDPLTPAGVPAAPVSPPGGAVEQSRARFLGCINGTHKFTSQRGRVTFTQAEINRAIKDGVLPPCR